MGREAVAVMTIGAARDYLPFKSEFFTFHGPLSSDSFRNDRADLKSGIRESPFLHAAGGHGAK
jgi:hypothetical protein